MVDEAGLLAMAKLYDVVCIDHFRGFDCSLRYSAGETTARNGEWRRGPGMEFRSRRRRRKLGRLNIIVEDFGIFATPSVLQLVKDFRLSRE